MFVMTNQCVTNRQLIGSNRNCLVIKTLSYQYSNSHYKDKTVSRLSCLYSGDSVNMGIRSLYWERVLRDTSGDALHDTTTKHQTCHYDDVIIGAMESQNTSLTIVYSTVYSNADQRKHKISASLIPRTNGQYRVKCFHFMTSSWQCVPCTVARLDISYINLYQYHYCKTTISPVR